MFIVYLLCQALNLRHIMAAVTMIDLLPSSPNILITILLLKDHGDSSMKVKLEVGND